MRSGVSTDSHAEDVTFAVVTGTADADYPISNLADLWEPCVVARVAPDAGTVVFTGTLAAAQSIQLVALVEHNIPDGASVRIELFSDVLTTGVEDTGAVVIPDRTDDPQTFPLLLDAATGVRSFRVTIEGLADDLEIGGVEIAAFWDLPWITAGEQAGFRVSGDDLDLVGGAVAGGEGEMPRTRSLQVSYLELDTSVTTRLDFQKLKGLARPFVYIEDYETPGSWPRDCFLATNTDTPAAAAMLHDRDDFHAQIEEHRR